MKLCQSLPIFCNSSPQVVELSLFLFLSRNYKGGTCLLLLLLGFGMDCAPRSWPLHPVYPFHQEAHTCRFHPKTLVFNGSGYSNPGTRVPGVKNTYPKPGFGRRKPGIINSGIFCLFRSKMSQYTGHFL